MFQLWVYLITLKYCCLYVTGSLALAIRKCSKETALTFLARLYTKVQEGNVVTLTRRCGRGLAKVYWPRGEYFEDNQSMQGMHTLVNSGAGQLI